MCSVSSNRTRAVAHHVDRSIKCIIMVVTACCIFFCGYFLSIRCEAEPSECILIRAPWCPEPAVHVLWLPYHSSHGEQVGMVAALLQVHHDVEQGHLVASAFGVKSLKVPSQNKFVIFPAGQKREFRSEPKSGETNPLFSVTTFYET